MTCRLVKLPDGVAAFVCGTTRRCQCGNKATKLCDWKTPGSTSGTCDKPLCARCTTSPAADKDLCPGHAADWQRWQADRQPG